MQVTVVYNSEAGRVIRRLGTQNQEKYFTSTIDRIVSVLGQAGHQVVAFEADMDLISRLEQVGLSPANDELPGLVFNLAYGVQGRARYTHVPGMLEMVGLPYVGSGPLAHGLALDKVVAKTILLQHGLPTPRYAVLRGLDFTSAEQLGFPLIVKPRAEASSYGLSLVQNEMELRQAAGEIFEVYDEDVLIEEYIPGREINVGLLGNEPLIAFPPLEIRLDSREPDIFTHEDKIGVSGKDVSMLCPAPLSQDITAKARSLACQVFRALGCNDFARVDMRLDVAGRLYVLELNSLPSLNQTASYPQAAAAAGLDFAGLINELVRVAYERYFGPASAARDSAADVVPALLSCPSDDMLECQPTAQP